MTVKELINILSTFDDFDDVKIDRGTYGLFDITSVQFNEQEGAVEIETE